MNRAHKLTDWHSRTHTRVGRPRSEWGDVLRGALVLAVGALDAAVLEIIVDAFPAQAMHGGLGKNAEVWTKDEPAEILLCFASVEPRKALAEHARSKLSTMTFQRARAIEGVLSGTLKCPAPWEELASAMRSPQDHWDEDRAVNTLDEYVRRRHRIAHDGDLDPKTGQTRPIRRDWVEKGLHLIAVTGRVIADVVDAHCDETMGFDAPEV